MVMRAPFVVRDHLVHAAPKVFFLEEHYRNYPAVLVRLSAAKSAQIRELIESAWRAAAPKRVVAEHDNEPGAAARTPPSRARAPSPPSGRARRGA